jgi:prepilin-type N-terminal cleavage/methylation domain-containing protein
MQSMIRSGARRTNGFTLIELLVVVALVAMLIAILLPALAKARAASKNTVCLARLHGLSLATVAYANEYKCVPAWGPWGALPMLETSPACWWCPADSLRPVYEKDSSYTYHGIQYMGDSADPAPPSTLSPQLALRHYEDNPQRPLFRDFDRRHPHRNAAFWDGAARKWEE